MTDKPLPIASQTLYAFWEHDSPPFLGGTITKMNIEGMVETKEYGRGSYFQPILIVPAETGRAIHAQLEDLESDKIEAEKALWTKYRASVAAIHPAFKKQLK